MDLITIVLTILVFILFFKYVTPLLPEPFSLICNIVLGIIVLFWILGLFGLISFHLPIIGLKK